MHACVLVPAQSGQGRGGFALGAAREDQNLVARQTVDLVRCNQEVIHRWNQAQRTSGFGVLED